MTSARSAVARRIWALLVAAMLLGSGAQAWAQPGKRAWTRADVSSGLHSLDQAATVAYQSATKLPAGAVITRVYADRAYAGQADVQTSLCWNGTQRCIDIVGRSINTRAFNGLDASQPMYLGHRARSWRGSRPPLYIKGNVTVWYEAQP